MSELQNLSSGNPLIRATSPPRTLSCGVFYHLTCTCKCPSDEGTPPMWGHFSCGAEVSADQRFHCIGMQKIYNMA